MKRVLSMILVFAMCMCLFSCGGKQAQEKLPDEITAGDEDSTVSVPADKSETPVYSELIAGGGFDPDYDYTANKSYKVCYLLQYDSVFYQSYDFFIQHWCYMMNIEYHGIKTCGDIVDFAANLEQAAEDYDGVILDSFSSSELSRASEIFGEAGCQWITFAQYPKDEEGTVYRPYIDWHCVDYGTVFAEYFADYAENEIDIPVSEIGVMRVLFTTNDYFSENEESFAQKLSECAPELYANMVDAPIVYYDESGGNDSISMVIKDHPEYSYWLCFAGISAHGIAANRAFTECGFENSSAVVAYGCTDAFELWDASTDIPLKAVYFTPVIFTAEYVVSALYAFMTGMATPDRLWIESGGVKEAEYYLATNKNYREILEWTDEVSGADFYNY